MSVKSDMDGLDTLKKNAERLSGSNEVKLVELFDSSFMANCSKHTSFEALVEASGFQVESEEDFAAIPNEEWDAYIATATSYSSWLEMQEAAVAKYTKEQLFKDL